MNRPSSTYRPTASNATIAGTVLRFTSSGTDPRKGWRTPLNKNRCSEQRDIETGFGYFGARYMDHELMTMWLSVDPMADKYPSISPYAYCAWNRPTGGHEHRLIKSNIVNNPVKLVDPNGEEVYMLFYTKGNKKGDGMFKAAALTRKRDIENSSSFDKDNDIVVLYEVSDLSSIQGSVVRIQKKYGEKYGKTKEFDLWSHGRLDGPTGSTITSKNRLDDGSGRNQMTLEGWGSINFNWSDNASASFYGCQTGVEDKGSSFAQRLSNCENFSGVLVSGMSDYGFPSYSSSSYQKHSDDYITSENNGNIVYKPTYMVSTNAMKRRFSNNCNPPNRYKDGEKVK